MLAVCAEPEFPPSRPSSPTHTLLPEPVIAWRRIGEPREPDRRRISNDPSERIEGNGGVGELSKAAARWQAGEAAKVVPSVEPGRIVVSAEAEESPRSWDGTRRASEPA